MTGKEPTPDEELIRMLDAAGAAERRAVLDEAERLETYPGEARARETLQRLIQEPPPQAAPGGRRGVILLLAAAAAVALAFVGYRVFFAEPSGTPDDYMVGPAELELLGPVGEVDEYGAFSWQHELLEGGWYELRVWDADAPEDAEPFDTVETEETTWTPDETLPPRIRWEVRAYGPSRAPDGFAAARASLSSR